MVKLTLLGITSNEGGTMFTRTSALGAVLVTAAIVAVPVLSASGDPVQTISFKEVNKGSTFKYVDNPPVNKTHKRPVFSPGDEFLFTDPIVDDKGKDGELRAKCTIERKAPASDAGFNNAHPLCEGALVLRDGTMFVDVAEGSNNVHGAISGGTGAYANARGTFQSTNTKTGSNDVVTLVP
jgi:hypothetical protein